MNEVDVFPKWKYHSEKIEGKIFYSEEEFKKAGSGWVNSPVDLEITEVDAPTESVEEKEKVKDKIKTDKKPVKKKGK